MFEEISNRKSKLGFVWARAADTGKTFLCPAAHTDDLGAMTEAELRLIGVDESLNPHND